MKRKKFLLVNEGFGHGFFAVLASKAFSFIPVAFSNKDTKEAFEAEVDTIYRNLSAFAPNMVKADWEERETYLNQGGDIRKDLLAGTLSSDIWTALAETKLTVAEETLKGLPQFKGMTGNDNVLFIPQKLKSDGMCGLSAGQQSLPLEVFDALRNHSGLVLGQHFHKVNDLDSVVQLAKDFNLYVPGLTEDKEVLGIRGVQHIKYWNLYRQLSGSIGIAGTHTWFLLSCFPEVPQVILFNKNGVEDWETIAKAYQNAGYQVYCIGFDENTNLQEIADRLMF